MELKLGPEVISSYKRLAYQAWYALAEFVDNSTQAYFNNQRVLDADYKKNETTLTVDITIDRNSINIRDNSIGMSENELKHAVYIGKPPFDTTGRSRYGLGLKTGASWFGDLWTIETKKLGDPICHTITVDVAKVAGGETDLPHIKKKFPLTDHWTVVEIKKLNRKITGRTLGKVNDHLRSLYRRDISAGLLILRVNGKLLSWDANVDKRMLELQGGKRAKHEFNFKVAGKRVSGWAGVLAKGSRKDAGFSIIQADRVIKGWPDSYRPITLFGDQVGGSNDLVNQRLVGELVLEKFEVSHTKDEIIFDDGEQETLEAKLKEELGHLRQMALTHRKDADERTKAATDEQRDAALNELEKEMESNEIGTFLKTFEVPSEGLIRKSNEAVANAVVAKAQPSLKAKINKLNVAIYLMKDMSPNDPYVIIESTKSETLVTVIINLAHPHWAELTEDESIRNFIRHCAYDGVAEWKAYAVTKKLEPDTIKLIKDNLLRIPFGIERS